MDGVTFVVITYLLGVVTGLLIPVLLKWLAAPKKKRRTRDDREYSRPRRGRRPRGRGW